MFENMTVESWNNALAALLVLGGILGVFIEWLGSGVKGATREPFDVRYMWFSVAPIILGVLQGTIATPIFDPAQGVIGQIIGALSAGYGLTRSTTMAGRMMGIHPKRQDDKIAKAIAKSDKEDGGNDA